MPEEPRPRPSRPAVPDRPSTLADLLVRAGAGVSAHRRRRAADLGLSGTGFAVLQVLDGTDGLVQRELAARVRVGPTTLTPVLDALEHDGLAVRATVRGDRRVRRVAITDAGRGRLLAARSAARVPRVPDPPRAHAGVIREYLLAVVASLEQDHRGHTL
ncbi:MarR family winged helix-turn-helix transcriptional regulator [Pseudonocardia sp. NPDC049635]|uniref:MarR family winged helix-turn-helix transcriptional regulator n=1 Tax=Pseudonocardia sp. NPDC049635 TaxID=3155506 RepID=UPI0033C87196